MPFNIFSFINVLFAALGLIEGLLNEPVGGPSVSAPAVIVTFGGHSYSVVVSANKIS